MSNTFNDDLRDAIEDKMMEYFAHNVLNRGISIDKAYEDACDTTRERVEAILAESFARAQRQISNKDFLLFESKWAVVKNRYPE